MRNVYCEGCGRFEARPSYCTAGPEPVDWPLWIQVILMLVFILGVVLVTGMPQP